MLKKIFWGILTILGMLFLLIAKPFLFFAGKISGYYKILKISNKYDKVTNLYDSHQIPAALDKARDLQGYIRSSFGENNSYYYMTKMSLCNMVFELGQFNEAIPELISSLNLINEYFPSNIEGIINILDKLTYSYMKLSNYKLALEYFNKLFSLEQFSYTHPQYFNAKNNLAQLYLDLNQLEKAEETFFVSKNYFEKNNLQNKEEYILAIIKLCEIYIEKGDSQLSLKLLEKALTLVQNYDPHNELFSLALYTAANYNLVQNNFDEAMHYINQGLKYYESDPTSEKDYISFKKLLGVLNFSKGQYKDSLSNLKEAISDNVSPKELDLKENGMNLFLLAENYFRLNDVENAKNYYSKYLSFLVEYIKEELVSLNEVERFQFVKSFWGAHNGLLSFAVNIFPEDKQFITKIFNYRILTKRLLTADFRNYDPSLDPFKRLLEKLPANSAVVEIMRFTPNDSHDLKYIIFVITKENQEYPEYILLDGKDIEVKYFKNYRKSIYNKSIDLTSASVFWKFLEPYIKFKDEILVSSDGVFRFISFNSLILNDGQYLIKTKRIRFFDSFDNIMRDHKIKNTSEPDKETACFFGAPSFDIAKTNGNNYRSPEIESPLAELNSIMLSSLPETEKEVFECENILRDKNWETKVYLNNEASKKNLLQVQSPTVLHIATHGFYLIKSNEIDDIGKILHRSGLFMSNCNINTHKGNKINLDGILTSFEIQDIDLKNTDLVILSSCMSGLGLDINTGDYLGLQRAFFKAGAKSIIMSLWEVDDKITMELISLFYKFWFETGNKGEALRKAQFNIMEMNPEPFYWGGFILIEK